MNHRIERARPAAALDIDAVYRIAASRRRPDDVIDAGRIDIVVDDDGEAILITAGNTLRGDHTGLFDVTGIALLDGDDGKLPRAGLVRPDAANVRHAGFLQLFPHMRRTGDRAQQGQRVRRPRRIRTRKNRIVAVEDPLHADKWLEALRTGVVARPLAERSFFLQLTGSDCAFENNFRICRIRQTGNVTPDHLDWFPLESACEVEFADTRRHRTRRGKPNQRIAAEHDVDRDRLIFLEVFLFMNVSVLARADIDSGGVLILRHDPISADVHPIGIGILGDDQVAGAEVASAVFFVQP